MTQDAFPTLAGTARSLAPPTREREVHVYTGRPSFDYAPVSATRIRAVISAADQYDTDAHAKNSHSQK
jgi:hypothetical protein